jgi:hypothetical protein
MASDIPLVFLAAFIVAGGIGAMLLMIPAARRRQRLRSEARRRRLSPSQADLDDYLARLDQAGTAEDIDRLGKGEE